ncbi:MAG TPA: SRPBCC domain-containing protein [Thermomicrobiales bacterium]|nr:SRPBCC domain-containing protein [Thermomicrobiales bacterium]
MNDTIEREIFIEAGIDRVWSLVSKAGFWVGDEVRFEHDVPPGETVVIETVEYGHFPVRVEHFDPPHRAVYTWASGFPNTELSASNSTRVEFTLTEQDGGVLVRVCESGFSKLDGTPDFRSRNLADNTAGWKAQMQSLRDAGEAKVAPQP